MLSALLIDTGLLNQMEFMYERRDSWHEIPLRDPLLVQHAAWAYELYPGVFWRVMRLLRRVVQCDHQVYFSNSEIGVRRVALIKLIRVIKKFLFLLGKAGRWIKNFLGLLSFTHCFLLSIVRRTLSFFSNGRNYLVNL